MCELKSTSREDVAKYFENLSTPQKIVMDAIYKQYQKIQEQKIKINQLFGDYSATYPIKINDNNEIIFAIVKREIRPNEMYYGFFLKDTGAYPMYYTSFDKALTAGIMYANIGNTEGANVIFRAIGLK